MSDQIDQCTYRSLKVAAYWPGAEHPDVAARLGINDLPEHAPPAVRVPSLALLTYIVVHSPYISLVLKGLLATSGAGAAIWIVKIDFALSPVVLNMYWAQ